MGTRGAICCVVECCVRSSSSTWPHVTPCAPKGDNNGLTADRLHGDAAIDPTTCYLSDALIATSSSPRLPLKAAADHQFGRAGAGAPPMAAGSARWVVHGVAAVVCGVHPPRPALHTGPFYRPLGPVPLPASAMC